MHGHCLLPESLLELEIKPDKFMYCSRINHKMMKFMEQGNVGSFFLHSVLNKIRHVGLQYFLYSLSLEYF